MPDYPIRVDVHGSAESHHRDTTTTAAPAAERAEIGTAEANMMGGGSGGLGTRWRLPRGLTRRRLRAAGAVVLILGLLHFLSPGNFRSNINNSIDPTLGTRPTTSITLASSLVSLIVPAAAGAAVRSAGGGMIGMLATGLLLRTSGFVHGVPHGWTTILFSLALSAVVARAGIRVPLRRNTSKVGVWSTVLIGGAPVLIETVWLAGILHGALRVPLDWATVAAAAVACVSPGVVVPILVGLADTSREWAEARIVRTLLAAVGVDVLVATTLFGVASAVLERRLCGNHSPVTLWWILFRAARELALGGMAGAGIAAAAVVLAPRVRHETVVKVWKWGGDKHVALFAATSTWMALAKTMGCPGAATSGVLVAWAAVGNMWDSTDVDIADKRLKHIWTLTEPFLFPLIGSSIHLAAFQPRILAAAGACVAASVAIKLCTTYAATTITRFERWERGFAAGVWTGKASVQAALSSVPLSLLSKHALTIPDLAQESIHGQTAFAAIVAAILIGAPLAASWVAFYKGSPTANTTTMQFAARSADATNEGDADAIGEKAAGMKSLEKTASKETLSLGKKPRILRSAVEGVMVV